MRKDQEYSEDNWNKKTEELGPNPNSILKGEPTTQEEVQSEHDAWWNSLTDEQKQQLYNDQEELFKLTIEEMNHERE